MSGVDPQLLGRVPPAAAAPSCRTCGCTEDDCRACIAKTGEPCYWVADGLCSACATPEQRAVAILREIAAASMEYCNQAAELLGQFAQPPRNELGVVATQAIQLYQQLDLTGAPAAELRRWAGLAAITAASAAQLVNACVIAMANPERGAVSLRPGGAAGGSIPASGGPPLIVTPDGRPAAAAGGLIDVAGRPLTSTGGGRG